MASIDSLKDLFVRECQDLYDAEHRIADSLPKMRDASSAPDLKQAFDHHLTQTRNQIRRLEQVFNEVGVEPSREKCRGIVGIVDEAEHLLKKAGDVDVSDAGLIASAQKVEHYEMAAYGSVIAWARELGLRRAPELLEETLKEEKETDQRLTDLSRPVNAMAAK